MLKGIILVYMKIWLTKVFCCPCFLIKGKKTKTKPKQTWRCYCPIFLCKV